MAATKESFTIAQNALASPSCEAEKTQVFDKKETLERHTVFYSTADTEQWGAVSGTGDVDYGNALKNALNHAVPGAACFLNQFDNEQDVYAYIEKHKKNATPILHVLKNAPRIGSAFTIEGLTAFKKTGGKVVVTAVEFNKHRWSRGGDQLKKDLLEAIRVSDEAVFLDELDKKAALEALSSFSSGNAELKTKLERAKIICVPPTVTIKIPPSLARGSDIISFGMVRTGKGLAHLRKLAGLIKQSDNPMMKDKKILVVGTVMLEPIQKETASGYIRNNLSRNSELYKLMSCIYPTKRKEMMTKTQGDESDNKTLKELLKKYQLEETQGALKPALPIELHLDVPEQELARLFMRSRYSYLPAYRGVTLRNTSISCSLTQAETGLVTLSHQGFITPKELQHGGCFEKALVLMPNEEYGTGDDDKGRYEYDGYAGAVFEEILKREKEPKLNEETLQVARELLKQRLSHTIVAYEHQSIYEALLKCPLSLVMNSETAASCISLDSLDPSKGSTSTIFVPAFTLEKSKAIAGNTVGTNESEDVLETVQNAEKDGDKTMAVKIETDKSGIFDNKAFKSAFE